MEEWLTSLPLEDYEQIIAALELLKDQGPTLGRPLVDTVGGSHYKNMKELRPGSSGHSEIRVLFGFGPQRQAILLVAGDRSRHWNKWYRRNTPRAAVEANKRRMLAETRVWRLGELREQESLAQTVVAEQLNVSQNRVSKIERGDIDKTEVETLRRYAGATGGQLCLGIKIGGDTLQLV